MNQNNSPVLIVNNISYSIGGNNILRNITFKVHKGEIIGIIGPNGAGKTTLVQIIIGDIQRHQGTFQLLGRIGYLPQFRSIDRQFPITAFEVARMGLYQFEKNSSDCRKKAVRNLVMESLESCGIEHLASRQIGTFSGGEYQRLLLARAILMQPELLILDEPEAGIDEMGKTSFFSLMKKLQQKNNMAVLMISHDIGLIFKACQRIMCLNRTLHCSKPSVEMSVEDLQSVFYDMDILIPSHDHYLNQHTKEK